ncbi:MAG: RNA polymerase factor sigma-70 [Lachnospiraceae bacterium]|nr:RNA polymerase factor sigma-70 [Lachnospiraceae bacterium]MBQ9060584.1 RNA polymerase factor sigma-70 [Bacillota bacterium]
MNREKYEDLTDEELIALFRDGDQDAMEKLLNKYKEMVLGKARSMYILGGDSDDLIQEGMLGLFKAVRDYDSGRDASFRTFAQLCVTRQLYTAVKASSRKKHLPLNTAISLSRPVREDGEEEEEFLDCLEADASSNPEVYLIGQEELERLEEKIEKELSPFERQVLELHLTGMGYVEIAHVLNRDEKSTDNALQRIRTKLKKWR